MSRKRSFKIIMTVSNEFTTDYRVHREAKALVKQGYDLTIFCVHKKGLARKEVIDGIKVERILDAHIRLPFTQIGRHVRSQWWQALLAAKADLYHAHDRDTLDLSARAAAINHAHLIYDSHEYWPDKNQYQANTGSLRDHVSEFWWNQKERHFIHKADAVIMTSPGHAQGLIDRYKIIPPTLVRNIPEYQLADGRQDLRNKFQLKAEDYVLVYVGNIQQHRGLEEVISSLVNLPTNTHLVIVGYGAYRNHLEKQLPQSLVSRVHFYGQVNYKEIIPIIAAADIGVAPFQANCFSHRHVLPNKIFEYMMAGLPIAASNFPDMMKIIKQVKYGIGFIAGQPGDIANVINKMLADPQRLKQMSKNALLASRKQFRWDIEQKHLIKLYQQILS